MAQRKEEKVQHTNCFITINTNQRDLSLLPAWQIACATVFNRLPEYIDFTNPAHTLETHINNIEVEYSREVGPSNKTVHVHALVKITHHSHIKLLAREIKEDLKKLMNIATDFHLDVKFLRAVESEINIRDYLRKNSSN